MQILAVDDDPEMLEQFRFLLEDQGHKVDCVNSCEAALPLVRSGAVQIVICDQVMAGMGGLDFCRTIRSERLPSYIYCIMISGEGTQDDRVAALTAGADDFIAKPFDVRELFERVQIAGRLMSMNINEVTVFALAKLAESRDPDTGAHLERVQHYCKLLARGLSEMPKFKDIVDEEFIRLLFQTSPLHDIGKVGIPDAVLLKPGKLTADEFEVMKKHTTIGEETLQAALDKFPGAMFLQMARDIAAAHHERYDGKGYPRQLAGEQIPLVARIVAVADVYDALTSKRIYKDAQGHERATETILEGQGTQFDPDAVDAFKKLSREFAAIRNSCRDELRRAA